MDNILINNKEELELLYNCLTALGSGDIIWKLQEWQDQLNGKTSRFPCIISCVNLEPGSPSDWVFYHPIDSYAPEHITLLKALTVLQQRIMKKRTKNLANEIMQYVQ